MKNEISRRLLNVVLRGASMGSRFILIIALAKLLEPSELGEYGLLLVSITFCVLMLGAEFHSYTMREINTEPPERWSFIVQHHALTQGVLFVTLFPVALLIFLFDVLSLEYIYWFSVLLFLELLNQEIHWLLIGMQKQILSSLVMFIRVGLWVYIVLPIMYLNPEFNNIQSVLIAWSIGGVSAILLGGVFVWKSVPAWKLYKVDKAWIKKGLKVGVYFLLAALSLKGLFTFDRFAIELLGTPDELGVYVFYIGLVMGAINFLEPAVFSFLYPKMIQSYHQRNKEHYVKLFNELAISTCMLSLTLVGMTVFLMPYVIQWIDKPIYTEYYDALYVLVAMGVTYAIGMIPHYGLYSMRSDHWIIGAQLSSIIVYLSIIAFYKADTSIMTVAIALLGAFTWMAIVKLVGYKITKQNSFLMVT